MTALRLSRATHAPGTTPHLQWPAQNPFINRGHFITVGIDLTKLVFQVHGVDARGCMMVAYLEKISQVPTKPFSVMGVKLEILVIFFLAPFTATSQSLSIPTFYIPLQIGTSTHFIPVTGTVATHIGANVVIVDMALTGKIVNAETLLKDRLQTAFLKSECEAQVTIYEVQIQPEKREIRLNASGNLRQPICPGGGFMAKGPTVEIRGKTAFSISVVDGNPIARAAPVKIEASDVPPEILDALIDPENLRVDLQRGLDQALDGWVPNKLKRFSPRLHRIWFAQDRGTLITRATGSLEVPSRELDKFFSILLQRP